MANKSGVPVENITSIAGVSAISMTRLVGVATRDIGVWPRSGPSCDDMPFSFGEAPDIACGADAEFYSFDSENSLLYTIGGCGEEYAPEGFYVDNRGSIFWWHLDGIVWVWEFIGPCEPPPSCDTLLLGYTDGRELPPTAACSADPMPYELDPLTNILYTEGGCGDERSLAPGGFYSDGVMIYSIGPEGTFIEVRPCE